ncbi:hypothetical protein V7161_09480 [Neobacillus drentensis]|uniref:hypothetical protein n=1 Tax=Neobacillus drentensis TaxID=220684 RepID=UPI003000362D
MLNDYMMKMNIVLPKTTIHLDKEVYKAGSNINGTIEVKGSFFKNKIKRYDIDLIGKDTKSNREETLNSHTVLCSHDCVPNKTQTIPFLFYVPEEIRNNPDSFRYSLIIRIVLVSSKSIKLSHPVQIQNAN